MGKALNIVIIVQARLGSTRFPDKVLKKSGDKTLIEWLLLRLGKSKKASKIVVATTDSVRDDKLATHIKSSGYDIYRGSENDVLDRYYKAAKSAGADVVVRITGDCPLIDAELVDRVIDKFLDNKVDYLSNVSPPTFPDGLDTEVFTFTALERAWKETISSHEREHVTPYLRESGKFRTSNYANEFDYSGERWTVDEPEDFVVINNVFNQFLPRWDFSWKEVIDMAKMNPEIFSHNKKYVRNEGASLGTGQKLWKRAKRIIPGGNMLLSKRAEMFLPDLWPAYFSKARGCKIWDMDGNEYFDVSIMGIGTNILGYGHKEVDEAVMNTVKSGNMSTFNCPEEVALAERLIEINPWAHKVRFARTGGEANAIAIRIARAASGKDKVAICGYHGWHDWYLSANLGDEQNLAGHLLPGLDPLGVPQNLRGTVLPFNYNNFSELEELVNKHEIGVIKMEVSRNAGPAEGYLQKIRQLATKRGIVLIFDECTSGFRQSFGGLHKIYGVEPDIAMFGKAMGNGYAITAVVGREEVMEVAQKTFISSTFWTERIGPSAALATLKVMERIRSWETITKTGNYIKTRWQELADKHKLSITQWGLPALAGFTFNSKNNLAYKTYITQEMLSMGYLAGNSIFVSIEHTNEVLEGYFQKLDKLFASIREFENGKDVMKELKGPVCHDGFKRLN